jgi:hypothetical protein
MLVLILVCNKVGEIALVSCLFILMVVCFEAVLKSQKVAIDKSVFWSKNDITRKKGLSALKHGSVRFRSRRRQEITA